MQITSSLFAEYYKKMTFQCAKERARGRDCCISSPPPALIYTSATRPGSASPRNLIKRTLRALPLTKGESRGIEHGRRNTSSRALCLLSVSLRERARRGEQGLYYYATTPSRPLYTSKQRAITVH